MNPSAVSLKALLCSSPPALDQIHAASLELIERTGIRFYSERAREIWHGAGAKVEGTVVKIPGSMVEDALRQAPRSFTLYARDGVHNLEIDGQRTYISQDGCAAHTLDFETGLRRQSTKEDIARMALISDSLKGVDIISPTVSAADAPATGVSIHELEACFLNSGKHVLTESVTNAREARAQIELGAAIAGGVNALRERPIFSNFVCTISPLIHDHGGMEAAMEFALAGVPVGLYPMATTGVTSPVTLAGSLAIANAEVISGLALLQIIAPGAKVFYCGGPATIDLRTSAYAAASPEAIWLRAVIARMAGYYHLPSIAGAGATSAKLPGPQAAWENALSFLMPALAGASVLFGAGLLDGSNLLAYEQIILDNEILLLMKRLLEPVSFDEDSFALGLIQELGAGGVYLDQRHTVTHMRKALSLPAISDREPYEEWQRKGRRDLVEAARARVREILANHQPPALPEGVRRTMGEIVAACSAQALEA